MPRQLCTEWFAYPLPAPAEGLSGALLMERLVMLMPAEAMGQVFERCQALLEDPVAASDALV